MSSTVHARTWKTFSLAIALLLSMGILPGLISTHRAAAQTDGISQSDFDDLVDEATADDPVYGPEEGDLDLDPDRVTFSTADVTPADFYAEAGHAGTDYHASLCRPKDPYPRRARDSA